MQSLPKNNPINCKKKSCNPFFSATRLKQYPEDFETKSIRLRWIYSNVELNLLKENIQTFIKIHIKYIKL